MCSEQNGTLQINIQTNVIDFVSGLNTTISSFLICFTQILSRQVLTTSLVM